MSEYNFNTRDSLAQLESFIESNTYQDSQDNQNLNLSNDTHRDDRWKCENLPGAQAEPHSHAHQDAQNYYYYTTQTSSDSPPTLSSWQAVQNHSDGQSVFAPDGDEPDYPNYFSAFSSGPREFGWAGFRWSEEQANPNNEQSAPYPPAEYLEGCEMMPTNSSCSLGYSIPEESNAPRFSQSERTAEDEVLFTEGTDNSSARGFNFAHMYEPAPSNVARPSLLTQWIDTSPQGMEASLNARPPVISQSSFADQERSWSLSQGIETGRNYDSPLGLYTSGCDESLVDAGSLPDLSRSRRQTPGSGPMDVTSTERPTTPFGSSVKYERAGYEYGDYQPTGSPGSFKHPFVSRNPTFFSAAETSRSRSSSIFAHGTSSESHSHLTEPSRPPSFNSRPSFCNILSTISIPSPPPLFANTPISRANTLRKPSASNFSGLLPPITDAHLQARPKETANCTNGSQSGKDSKKDSSRSKSERPKRKRMHICHLCGKDFNRPSALLLHATVHTGERSNFCNVCGRSFSNLSNLRRHQRQLHVLESQMRLPEIPGPTSELDAYNFGSQTRF
ncbi:hypothetical protein PGTUg99_025851 [Puccinia graminis f. sp. tritici]|uniref:C2H2-type domain-containing protein n=1 Tax=Puccinia graminis f. sp. tritici TaxID=56615 RepID=A0A5B0Q476_PUCGR|nr:hypothetical protein PGTUg99_025851 [Puccinia graminis f. sp. tritici]